MVPYTGTGSTRRRAILVQHLQFWSSNLGWTKIASILVQLFAGLKLRETNVFQGNWRRYKPTYVKK
jgi:hypothetical protein